MRNGWTIFALKQAGREVPKKRKRKADGNGATHDGFVHGDGGQITKKATTKMCAMR